MSISMKHAIATGLFAALFGACSPSELLVDVSGITSSIDELDVYVATQTTADGKWNVSQRIVVSSSQGLDKDGDGHYKLTLNHSLSLDNPGQAQVFIGAMAQGCLRGTGSAIGELKSDGNGYTALNIALSSESPQNESMPCSATQPKITSVDFTRTSRSDNTATAIGIIHGWGFNANSQVHIKVVLPVSSQNMMSVDENIMSSEAFPDHLQFPLDSLVADKTGEVASILSPLPNSTKSIEVNNGGGTADSVSNLFSFK